MGLQSTSIQLNRNTIYLLVGPNGSGKSTLLKILSGLIKPTTGEGSVLGTDLKNINTLHNQLGFVPDIQPSIPNVTPRKFFRTLRILRGLDKSYDKKWLEYCENFQLAKWIDRPLNWFSQGMLKRISIVTGVFHEPKLLFMDEPLENLDTEGKTILDNLLQDLLNKGCTIVISSHILKDDGFNILKPQILFMENLFDRVS